MNRVLALLVLFMAIGCGSADSFVPKSAFYQRAMAAIPTPDLNQTAEATTSVHPYVTFSLTSKIDTDPRFPKHWYSSGRESNPKSVGLGLTIAGSILVALGTGLIIANANAKYYQSSAGPAGGPHLEADILGVLLIAGGTGMLVPGIILLCRKN
jgi:hypothetical protein